MLLLPCHLRPLIPDLHCVISRKMRRSVRRSKRLGLHRWRQQWLQPRTMSATRQQPRLVWHLDNLTINVFYHSCWSSGGRCDKSRSLTHLKEESRHIATNTATLDSMNEPWMPRMQYSASSNHPRQSFQLHLTIRTCDASIN